MVLGLCLLGSMPVLAAEREGSLPQELEATQPPPPNEIYVAVFPFWSRDERQSEIGRACSMLNLMRHGFRMAPKGSSSLAAVRCSKSKPSSSACQAATLGAFVGTGAKQSHHLRRHDPLKRCLHRLLQQVHVLISHDLVKELN